MHPCDTCGNEYHRSFALRTADGEEFHFDSFECAIEKVAPRCAHCNCRIIGHGIEGPGHVYCCANCAREGGDTVAIDNATAGHGTDPVHP